jgi:zinc protease
MPDKRLARLEAINQKAPRFGSLSHIETINFGGHLKLERFRMANGLEILTCEDHSAPVVSYHTWFRVGSRHEQEGKTGLAHLFEHLMFNEVEGRASGEFDRKLEEAGAESNASTWLDWTQYNVSVPKDRLALVVGLEAERMSKLVVRDPQVTSEKEVVANERRYRVDDDVEGSVSETLWATAFTRHAYRWPTIGWMRDIENFTTADCEEFYRTYYAPNNATLVVVGDFNEAQLLAKISTAYGDIPASTLPVEDYKAEPPQVTARTLELKKPTPTEKIAVGYHSPAIGDFDHLSLSILIDILFSGRASRAHKRLIRELEIASDVRAFVGPFRDPGLVELYASAREGHTAEELLAAMDTELERVRNEAVPIEEIERAIARTELGLLGSLETVDGKAQTIGFYETVLGRPAAGFERLELLRRVGPSDVLRAARRFLDPERRNVIWVRADLNPEQSDQSERTEPSEQGAA